MNTEVKFLRLNNGEDLVSEVQETDTCYILLNPCKVMYLSSAKPGYLSISLMQWVFSRICEEQTFEIPKRDVLFTSYPTDHMIEHYWQSNEQFMNSEKKQKIDFDTYISDDEEGMSAEVNEALDMLKEYFNKADKGKLH